MKKLILNLLVVGSTIYFNGCSQKALSSDRAGTISQTYTGVVKNVEMVKIQGEGGWSSLFGMIIGGVLGHQIGGGDGKELATIGGSIAGSIAGAEADVHDAQRITVEFDSGKTITTVLPLDFNNSTKYKSGDRITVYITGNRVTEIR